MVDQELKRFLESRRFAATLASEAGRSIRATWVPAFCRRPGNYRRARCAVAAATARMGSRREIAMSRFVEICSLARSWRTAVVRSGAVFLRDAGHGLLEVGHNSLALLGLLILGVALF